MERHFTGFSRQAFQFLKDLKANNDKAWFAAHRSEYEQYLLQPLSAGDHWPNEADLIPVCR